MDSVTDVRVDDITGNCVRVAFLSYFASMAALALGGRSLLRGVSMRGCSVSTGRSHWYIGPGTEAALLGPLWQTGLHT